MINFRKKERKMINFQKKERKTERKKERKKESNKQTNKDYYLFERKKDALIFVQKNFLKKNDQFSLKKK